jgi:hypothetical protein
VSNQHTRKTFFAKALAGLAGLGLLGSRLSAKNSAAPASSAAQPLADSASHPFKLQPDARAVARSPDSL